MKSEVRKRKNCEDEHTDRTVEGRGRENTNLCSDPPVKVERARLLERDRREDRCGLMESAALSQDDEMIRCRRDVCTSTAEDRVQRGLPEDVVVVVVVMAEERLTQSLMMTQTDGRR